MGNNYHEKEYDDEVYEDDYYDEHYNEEELMDDSEPADGRDFADDAVWDEEKKVVMSFACEDCDYRWEDQIVKAKDSLEDEVNDLDVTCPMCGSMNITQI